MAVGRYGIFSEECRWAHASRYCDGGNVSQYSGPMISRRWIPSRSWEDVLGTPAEAKVARRRMTAVSLMMDIISSAGPCELSCWN